MGCCNLKIENTGMQANSSSLSIGKNSEFNEVCLDSLPKSENTEKKLCSTYGSTSASYNRKDIEIAFLSPAVHRYKY